MILLDNCSHSAMYHKHHLSNSTIAPHKKRQDICSYICKNTIIYDIGHTSHSPKLFCAVSKHNLTYVRLNPNSRSYIHIAHAILHTSLRRGLVIGLNVRLLLHRMCICPRESMQSNIQENASRIPRNGLYKTVLTQTFATVSSSQNNNV